MTDRIPDDVIEAMADAADDAHNCEDGFVNAAAIRDALAAADDMGWKLCPREPTQAMIDAGFPAGEHIDPDSAPDVWAAMIDAAPKP